MGVTVSVNSVSEEATTRIFLKMSGDTVDRPDWIVDYEVSQTKGSWECQKGMSAQEVQEQGDKIELVLSVTSYAGMLQNPVLSAGLDRCVSDMAKLQGRKGLSDRERERISKTFECVTKLSRNFQMVQRDLGELNQHLLVLRNTIDPHYYE